MVNVTIYIEGFAYEKDQDTTFDNSVFFREAFNRLFYQSIKESEFNIVIQPIGSITKSASYLKKINTKGENAILLVDLETSKINKQKKIDIYFKDSNSDDIFFMIQEMEGWILSQPQILERYGELENLIVKKNISEISKNSLLKDKHPEDIVKPSDKLKTLFKQYFSTETKRRGKIIKTNKNYSKTKDAPKLIQLLNLKNLELIFEDAENLVKRIQKN